MQLNYDKNIPHLVAACWYIRYAGSVNDADEVWLVAGGEPGAERFGQLVQRLRRQKRLSVGVLAAQADLSVGTIRAIEQGRRAPSEASGTRLLQVLLPAGALSEEREGDTDARQLGPGFSFTNPESGTRVVLEFKAKIAGDNRRWSSDKPSTGESRAEAHLRELMRDPQRSAELVERLLPAFAVLGKAAAIVKVLAASPASDADFGRIVRRLAGANAIRLDLLEKLLDLWDRVDSGEADAAERDVLYQLETFLDTYGEFPDEDISHDDSS